MWHLQKINKKISSTFLCNFYNCFYYFYCFTATVLFVLVDKVSFVQIWQPESIQLQYIYCLSFKDKNTFFKRNICFDIFYFLMQFFTAGLLPCLPDKRMQPNKKAFGIWLEGKGDSHWFTPWTFLCWYITLNKSETVSPQLMTVFS